MDLVYNRTPLFTEWIARSKLLSSPFVLVDAGVQGGVHSRWHHLGRELRVYGFDPLEEAIAPLVAGATPTEHYYVMGLGDEDGDRDLFVAPEATQTSFYEQGPSPFDVSSSVAQTAQIRRVPIRKLDSLAAEGLVPSANFIKIDCEGFEPEVLKGSAAMLAADVVGIETEASFNVSSTLPRGHFETLSDLLIPHGFRLYDIAFSRVSRAHYASRARELGTKRPAHQGRPARVDILFCLDSPPTTTDELIKRAIMFELYGLNDAAYDLCVDYADLLPAKIRCSEMTDKFIRRKTWRERAKRIKDFISEWSWVL